MEWKPKITKVLLDSRKGDKSEDEWFNDNKRHFIFFKLCSRIFEIIHQNIKLDEEGEKKKTYKRIEDHLQNNMEKIVREFERLGEEYKNSILKQNNAQ